MNYLIEFTEDNRAATIKALKDSPKSNKHPGWRSDAAEALEALEDAEPGHVVVVRAGGLMTAAKNEEELDRDLAIKDYMTWSRELLEREFSRLRRGLESCVETQNRHAATIAKLDGDPGITQFRDAKAYLEWVERPDICDGVIPDGPVSLKLDNIVNHALFRLNRQRFHDYAAHGCLAKLDDGLTACVNPRCSWQFFDEENVDCDHEWDEWKRDELKAGSTRHCQKCGQGQLWRASERRVIHQGQLELNYDKVYALVKSSFTSKNDKERIEIRVNIGGASVPVETLLGWGSFEQVFSVQMIAVPE